MVNLLSITLFTLFTTFSAHCMETPQKEETPTKKTSIERMFRRKSSSSIPRKSLVEKSIIHTTQAENPFIIATNIAIQSKDYSTVKFYLTNSHTDPNTQDQSGYPAIHIFAQAKAYDGIHILLNDARTDISKRDINGKLVCEYIDKGDINLRELRHQLFARFTLDMVTNQFCERIKSLYTNALATNMHFTEIIRTIKEKIEQDAIKQNENNNDQNCTLAQSACFPEYATDEFMTKKFWFILSSL